MRIIIIFLKLIYKFISKLKLIPLLLTYITYLILKLFNINIGYGSVGFVIIGVMFGFSILYFAYNVFIKLNVNIKPKNKEDKKVKDVKNENTSSNENLEKSKIEKTKKYPIYYEVLQDSRYVFAEYEDKYKLYLKTENGLKYIKTDYKK